MAAGYALTGLGDGAEGYKDKWEEVSLAYQLSGKAGADAAEEASKSVAEAQDKALAYLMSVEEVPQAYRTASTAELGMLYGLDGPEMQQQAYQSYLDSPIRANVMTGLEGAEESILRNQAATGRLRGGDSPYQLAKLSTDLEQAAFSDYLGGLGGLAQLQTNPEGIAEGFTSSAETLASGQIAAQQAASQGAGNIASLGMAALTAFSDPRLKQNVKVVGEVNGLPWCTWDWNSEAEKLGLSGSGVGVMANDVEEMYPECSGESMGYKTVDYGRLLNAS